MLSENILPLLVSRFADRRPRLGKWPEPDVTFAAGHPDVGDCRVHFDSDEVKVFVGEITYGRFGCYDNATSDGQAAAIWRDLSEFLDALFG